MVPYRYMPIDLNRPGIRLLILTRGYFWDDIRCELFDGWVNQSDGGIPYDALSYTWGSTELVAQITVNGCTMYVTESYGLMPSVLIRTIQKSGDIRFNT
jgi:hypothetical protein